MRIGVLVASPISSTESMVSGSISMEEYKISNHVVGMRDVATSEATSHKGLSQM